MTHNVYCIFISIEFSFIISKILHTDFVKKKKKEKTKSIWKAMLFTHNQKQHGNGCHASSEFRQVYSWIVCEESWP